MYLKIEKKIYHMRFLLIEILKKAYYYIVFTFISYFTEFMKATRSHPQGPGQGPGAQAVDWMKRA